MAINTIRIVRLLGEQEPRRRDASSSGISGSRDKSAGLGPVILGRLSPACSWWRKKRGFAAETGCGAVFRDVPVRHGSTSSSHSPGIPGGEGTAPDMDHNHCSVWQGHHRWKRQED